MSPKREPTRAEKAKAKAKEIGETAKFRAAAKLAADKVQAEQDADAERKRQKREK
jgi:hypothetical protein